MDTIDGIKTIVFEKWEDVVDYYSKDLINLPGYIYRGQKDSSWLIESSYDRIKKQTSIVHNNLNRHLRHFKNAVRGRRGTFAQKYENDNEWWALGRHYGLATPLLDWTSSPFVALFFAFEEQDIKPEYRVVYAFQGATCFDQEYIFYKELIEQIELFNVDTNENNRMIGQSGVFMKLSEGKDLETIIRNIMPGYNKFGVLVKLLIKNQGREDCLKLLSRMNINHATIFPDISGAALYCNMAMTIESYVAGGYIKFI